MPNIQLQFRRGTTTEWSTANPTLAAGEMGLDTVTKQFKIGDGTTAWNTLAYGGIQGPIGPVDESAVIGPASATDNGVVRFDGITGKLIQDSAVTIGDSGNTVISVTDNTNAALRITQLGTGNALLVEDSTNPDSTPFVIDANGQLGIGTLTPTSQVDVLSTTLGYRASRFTLSTGTGAGIEFRKSASATIGTNTIVAQGDTIGRVIFAGADGSTYPIAAEITGLCDGTPGTNDMPGRLVFSTTADGANTPTERMRIDSAGNVAISASGTSAGTNFRVSKTMTGSAVAYGITNTATVASDVTTTARSFNSFIATQATAFTLPQLIHYRTEQGTIGLGSSLTNQYGFWVDASLTGATNNYGFFGNIASGANRWNLYMAGTAANYLGGQLQLGQDYIEKTNVANTNTAITLNLANGTYQVLTLTGSPTITMPAAIAGKSFVILLKTGTGSYTVTWATVKWPGGVAPTITSTASKQDIFSFFSDGTNWYGTVVGQNYTP